MTKLAMFLILSLGLTVVGKLEAQNETFTFASSNDCARSELVEAIILEEYKETPLSQSKIILKSAKNGRLYEGILVIYMNLKTRDHTLVVHFDEGISCVLGSGTDFAPAKSNLGVTL